MENIRNEAINENYVAEDLYKYEYVNYSIIKL